jgi:hypothetical protein
VATKTIEPGTIFGYLKVNGHPGSNKHGQAMYACTCECGKTVIVAGYKLRRGEAKSCGCKRAALRMATMQAVAEAETAGKDVQRLSTLDEKGWQPIPTLGEAGAAEIVRSDRTTCETSNAAEVVYK